MRITKEMIEEGAKVARRFAYSVKESDPEGFWSDCHEGEQERWRDSARAVLEAALAVAPEPVDHSALIAEVLEAHVGRLGTHYEGCWKYHAACLALLLRKAEVVAPPKNEGDNNEQDG